MRRTPKAWLAAVVSSITLSASVLASAQQAPAEPAPSPPPSPPSAEPAAPAAAPEVAPADTPPAADAQAAEAAAVEAQAGEAVPGEVTEAVAEAEAPASAQGEPEADDIVVTGSRIRRKDLLGPSPVVVLSRERMMGSGRSNVGEFLQTLPEQGNATGRGTNNSSDIGAIRVNLRGLGEPSTLVLLNGRRLAPGGLGADDSVDLSAVPSQIIERIEVLKDGASAVYGSDAIAGVVNVITRKRFEGVEAEAYGSTTTHWDGSQIDAHAVAGAASERGSVLFSAGYFAGAPIWAGNRDYSIAQYGLDLSGGGAGMPYRQGSATVPWGTIALGPSEVGVQNGNAFYNSIIRDNPAAASLTRDPLTGQWRAFRGGNLPEDGGDGWNYQPYTYIYTPQQRFNAFVSGTYQLDPNVRLFFDSFYTKRNSERTLAPEPLNLSFLSIDVSGQSIYNPFGRDFASVNRRLLEFGRRTSNQDLHNFHLSVGLDGDLPSSAGPLADWFWELVFNYNRNESTEVSTGNLRGVGLRNALGPSFIDETGSPRCGTPDAVIDRCVPLDLFGGPGSISQDQVTGLTFTGVMRGYNQLIGTLANVSGPLFTLAAERPVALALGYEFRALSGGQIPDPITVAGETSGSAGLITEGRYSVHEVYAEFNAPIVEKRPALEALELMAAARGSFYSNFGDTFNYKLGARWAPSSDFALRGTYSTAFRAPTITELYQGTQDNYANVSDPCGSVEPGSALARNCGDAANNGETANQLRSNIGGNANLRPEKAKIFTVGVVLTPRAVKNLSITADYFNTHVDDTIRGIGENTILNGCYPSAAGVAPRYCDLIRRDPLSQRVSFIDNLNANVGSDQLDGIDFSANYALTSAAGNFNLNGAVAYLRRYERTLADGAQIHGAGTWDLNESGTGGTYPHFRFNAGIDWAYAGFSAGLRTEFIGSYRECGDSDGDLSGLGLCYLPDHVGERDVDAYNVWDLVLGYGFDSGAGRTTLSIGSTNLFDVAPPRVYNGFASTTDSYSYDMAMRVVYARIGHRF